MFIHRLWIGLIFITLGVVLVRFALNIIQVTGSLSGISTRLTEGSSILLVKSLGVVMIAIAIIYTSGLSHAIFGPILSPLSHLFPSINQ